MQARTFIRGFILALGILATVGAGFFAFLGAGMYGSPFSEGDDYFKLSLACVLLFGPLAVLPCMLIDHFKPGLGGLILCGSAIVDMVAIALNNSGQWGFAIHNTGLVILSVALPTFALGSLLFLASDRRTGRLCIVWWIEVAVALIPCLYLCWAVGGDGLAALITWLQGGTI